MLTEKLKDYVHFTKAKRGLEADLAQVKGKLDELEQQIVELMIDAGMDSAKVDGMTVYRKRRVVTKWRDDYDKEATIAAMLEAGDSRLLGFNYQSLVSFAKEHTDEQTGEVTLPDYLQGVLEVKELSELGARSS